MKINKSVVTALAALSAVLPTVGSASGFYFRLGDEDFGVGVGQVSTDTVVLDPYAEMTAAPNPIYLRAILLHAVKTGDLLKMRYDDKNLVVLVTEYHLTRDKEYIVASTVDQKGERGSSQEYTVSNIMNVNLLHAREP